ncbi:soluble calcium-activated nucleotidase 1 [Lasioglossum baleicum]|uniref:soluble calcium-activated nucleotidase 1 n=1 Tax=Lasioglossum baleicum TaxID=434251 RepID=UPI003FCE3E31
MTSVMEAEVRNRMKNRNLKMSYLHDWRQALRAPHVYRVANSTFRIQNQYVALIFLLLSVPMLLIGFPLLHRTISSSSQISTQCRYYKYNNTYPLSPPAKTPQGITYRIAIVSDLDHDSKILDKKNTWHSLMKTGSLLWNPSTSLISVVWDDKTQILTTSLTMKGRGMELSELVTFDGRLLSFDDRTGVVYAIEGEEVYPWIILMNGNGKNTKGFKSEWATVKDEHLYVGSMGKEWTSSTGEFENNDPLWVKVVSPRGDVSSLNWIANYKRLRQAINIEFPGYMIHESGIWSDIHKSWFFLPRRCSRERYNDDTDERMSCNVLLTVDENFVDVKVTEIGSIVPIRGFSSFKFLPGSQDLIIVALKTEEYLGQTATYIMAFTIKGVIIMPDTRVIDKKFEGLEFI